MSFAHPFLPQAPKNMLTVVFLRFPARLSCFGIFLLLAFGTPCTAIAQVFPLDLQQNLPALPTRLTDLTDDPLTNYQVSLNLMDSRESSVQVFLRLRLEGSNIRIQSRRLPAPVIHTVNFGQPLTLSGMDIAYLFDPRNLVFQGASAADFFKKGGLLDEGFYTLCLEAFLVSKPEERGVSNENCLPLFIAIQEPPNVTYPIADQTVPATNPASLSFTWLDQTAVAGAVNFDLEVTEVGITNNIANDNEVVNFDPANSGNGSVNRSNNIIDPRGFSNPSVTIDPNSPIVRGNAPNANAPTIFKQGLTGLSYNLQPEDPQLVQGRFYAVRVRAYDPMGSRRYRNQGWSAPVIFQYGEECLAPTDVYFTPQGDIRMRGNWTGPFNALGYTVRIQNTNVADAPNGLGNWYGIATTLPTILLDRLEESSTYNYTIAVNCSGGPGPVAYGTFTTPGPPNVSTDDDTPNGNNPNGDSDDGNEADPVSPTETGNFAVSEDGEPYQPIIEACVPGQPLSAASRGTPDPGQTLAKNGRFKMGFFDVRVATVSGSTSSGFTGTGTLLIPWLEQGAVAVAFDGIKLDKDRKLAVGTISPKRGKEKLDVTGLSASFGPDETCANYTEVVLDERGFDDDGVHYLTGTKLDPYGFDATGIYHGENFNANSNQLFDPGGFDASGQHANGTRFDDNGCDRDGLNQYGQPCIWRSNGDVVDGDADDNQSSQAGGPTNQSSGGSVVNGDTYNTGITPTGTSTPGAPTVSGTNYASELGDNPIRQLTGRAVDSMIVRIDRQKALYGTLQSAASTAVSLLVSVTGLDRDALVGPNDELLAPEMSKEYPDGYPEADPDSVSLAYRAYNLAMSGVYKLDKYTLDTLMPLRDKYTEHQLGTNSNNPTGIALADHVALHLKALDGTQIATFRSDPEALFQWVRTRVAIKVFELFVDPGAGYTEWVNPGRERRFRAGYEGAMLADAGGMIDVPRTAEARENDWRDYLRKLKVIDYDPVLGFELPIKIEKKIGGDRYAIYIDDIDLGMNGGVQIDAFTVLPRPGKDGEYIVFKGTNIPLNANGVAGNPKLQLYSKLDIGLGSYGTMTFQENSDTYVEFDCAGYKGFSLDGEVLFCRDKVMPLEDDGTLKDDPLPNGDMPRVKFEFDIKGQSWLNMTLDLTADQKFAVKGLRQVWWETSGLHVDFSEEVSDETKVSFPDSYVNANVVGGKPNPLWQGVAIKRLDAVVDVFDKRPQGQELRFTAEDLIIDNSGVSIKATGYNIVDLQQGKIGKWAVSLDTAFFHLQQSSFVSAFVKGAVELPVNEDNQTIDTMRYVGQASETEGFAFSATLTTPRKFTFSALKSEMTLMPNTALRFGKNDQGKYRVMAQLYGELKMGENKAEDKLKIPKIVFEDFRLATSAPYVDLGPTGRFGIQGAGVKLSGFELEIRRLELFKADPTDAGFEQFGVDVEGALSLMGGSSGFAASGGVTVFGSVDDRGPRLRVKYEKLKVNDLFFNVKIPGVKIAGGVRFIQDDPTYGDGFQGMIDARFDGVGLGVSAAGMFGSITAANPDDDYRYWFVDAAVQLPIGSTSIPLIGVVHLTGIGGGASYHMTRSDVDLNASKEDQEKAGPPDVDFTKIPKTMPPIGQGLSGLTFVPDKKVGLGLRLMTAVATFPTASVMNGALLLGAEFTSSGGLNKMYFAGNASFMAPTKPDGLPIKGTDPIFRLGFDIQYSHWNKTVSGGLYSWLNYVGLVKGAGGKRYGYDNFLGQIEMKMSPTESYLWVGRPYRNEMGANDPRFKVALAPLNLTIGTYFDFGTKLPAPPTLPSGISAARAGGGIPPAPNGFMHGTEIEQSTGQIGSGKLGCWIEFSATAGYNVLITNGLRCGGRTNFGVNKWYLVGNAYAAIEAKGEIVWVDFGPIDLSAYAEVQGPNPTYVYGAITYDNEKFDFDFGTSCSWVSDPPPAPDPVLKLPFQELITATRPAGSMPLDLTAAVEIDVAEKPNREFLVPYGTTQRRFRVAYDKSDVKMWLGLYREDDAYVSTSNTTIKVSPPPGGWKADETYLLKAKVRLEEKVNGSWRTYREDGKPFTHTVEVEINTDEAPDFDMISSTTPNDGATNVNVGAPLSVSIDKSKLRAFFNATSSYRYLQEGDFQAFLYPTGNQGALVSLNEDAVNGGRYFELTTDTYLEPLTDYTLRVIYKPKYKQGFSGPDRFVKVGPTSYKEELTITFRTGERQTTFKHEDVAYAYPRLMQYNTYRDQRSGRSFVRLNSVPEGLIGKNWIDPTTQELVVRYVDNVSRDTVATTGVNLNETLLWWEAIPQFLGLDKTYELQVSLAAKGTAANAGGEAPTEFINPNAPADGAQPLNSGGYPNGHVLFQNWFRTSQYATFEDKISNIAWSQTATFDRKGMMSARYTQDETEVPIPDDPNAYYLPYVNDSTIRSLGYGGYRDAVGLTEPFSAQELGDGQVLTEMENTNYVKTLRDDVFGYSNKVNIPACASTGTPGGDMFINDLLDEYSVYLRQGVDGPVLSERSGHREGGIPLAGRPSTTIWDNESTPLKTVEQVKLGSRPGTEYQNAALVRAAPLVLVNNLHPGAVRQHNNSFVVRDYKVPVCDPPNFEESIIPEDAQNQLDNFNNRWRDFADLQGAIGDAIKLAGMLGSNGPLGGGNGLGPLINPGNDGGADGFGDLISGGTNLGGGYFGGANGTPNSTPNQNFTVTVNNTSFGGAVNLSAGGLNFYSTQNFGAGGNNFNLPDMNERMDNLPNGGQTDLEEQVKWWQRMFVTESRIPASVPDPRGQLVRVKLVYRIVDHEGTVERYDSFPIDVTVN